MYIDVNGHKTYAYTGGKDFNPSQPTAVLIHGVLCDHSVWALQSRYLANHGWNVLAIDLPGHCEARVHHLPRYKRLLSSSKPCWTPIRSPSETALLRYTAQQVFLCGRLEPVHHVCSSPVSSA